MPMKECTDPVVGDILSGWRYDISGITPAMRGDYEQHLVECELCRSRQRLHRAIDVTLIALSSASIAAFLIALAIIHEDSFLHNWDLIHLHFDSLSFALTLRTAAIAGLLVSLVAWVLVAIATPAPSYLTGVALAQARNLQEHIPEHLRERFNRNIA